MAKIKIYGICISISYQIEYFGPREDVIFKRQLFFVIFILFINLFCSIGEVTLVYFRSCVIKYFSLKNSIPILNHLKVEEN